MHCRSTSNISTPSNFQRTVHVSVDSNGELLGLPVELQRQLDLTGRSSPSSRTISEPRGFERKIHVTYDINKKQFVGLPDEWKQLLLASGIDEERQHKFPDALIKCLSFQTTPHPRPLAPLPTAADTQEALKKASKISPKDPRPLYTITSQIGQGGNGSVFSALEKSTGHTVAIKTLSITPNLDIEALKNEIAMARTSVNDHIVKYFQSYLLKETRQLWLVMEYLEGGSLANVLSSSGPLPEEALAAIAYDILLALDSLHSKHRLHRDLKSDNVMLTCDGMAKLGDFGFCIQLTAEEQSRSSTVGTYYWMSPEVITSSNYNVATDIWSLGVLCYECLTSHPPYFDLPPLRAIFVIATEGITLPKDLSISSSCKDFINRCLAIESTKRPSAAELLDHPFLLLRNRECLPERISTSKKQMNC
ncbi:hypothetical protein GEMRC1_008490 [Eukaryota sp. GEM-RC1]